MDCKTFASLEVEAYCIVYFVLYIAVDSYAEHDFPASERRSPNTMMYTLTLHTRGYEVVFHFPSAIRRLRIFHAWWANGCCAYSLRPLSIWIQLLEIRARIRFITIHQISTEQRNQTVLRCVWRIRFRTIAYFAFRKSPYYPICVDFSVWPQLQLSRQFFVSCVASF